MFRTRKLRLRGCQRPHGGTLCLVPFALNISRPLTSSSSPTRKRERLWFPFVCLLWELRLWDWGGRPHSLGPARASVSARGGRRGGPAGHGLPGLAQAPRGVCWGAVGRLQLTDGGGKDPSRNEEQGCPRPHCRECQPRFAHLAPLSPSGPRPEHPPLPAGCIVSPSQPESSGGFR